jgi:hypothetical protein
MKYVIFCILFIGAIVGLCYADIEIWHYNQTFAVMLITIQLFGSYAVYKVNVD